MCIIKFVFALRLFSQHYVGLKREKKSESKLWPWPKNHNNNKIKIGDFIFFFLLVGAYKQIKTAFFHLLRTHGLEKPLLATNAQVWFYAQYTQTSLLVQLESELIFWKKKTITKNLRFYFQEKKNRKKKEKAKTNFKILFLPEFIFNFQNFSFIVFSKVLFFFVSNLFSLQKLNIHVHKKEVAKTKRARRKT